MAAESNGSGADARDSGRSDARSPYDDGYIENGDFDNDDDDDRQDDDSDDGDRDSRRSDGDRDGRRRNRDGSRSPSRTIREMRAKNRALEAKLAQLSKGLGNEPGQKSDAPDPEALRKSIRDELSADFTRTLNSERTVTRAMDILRDEGCKIQVRRAVRLLGLEDVDTVDGKVSDDDLADMVEDLREDSPELFSRRRTDRSSRDSRDSRDVDRDDEREEQLDRDGGSRRSRSDNNRDRRPARDGDYGGSRNRSNGNGRPVNSLTAALQALSGGRDDRR